MAKSTRRTTLLLATGIAMLITGCETTANQPYNGKIDKLPLSASIIDSNPRYSPASPDKIKYGAALNGKNGVFTLWAPTADKIILNFYSAWDQRSEDPDKSYKLRRHRGGIWQIKLSGVNSGQLYQYEIHFGDKITRALDPYAKAMAMFNDSSSTDKTGKGAVIDPSVYNPENFGYAEIPGYTKREDAVIYEVHVRDFTSDPELKTNASFGTYKAFSEKLDYLKDLGVTHIELLPVISYYYGDESRNHEREIGYSASGSNYNWGYDPHNYFTPEGMYSENPENPGLRIKELKDLINDIHKHGMGVILDVVFNHTANTSIFENIVPGYYYRRGDKGELLSNSGCGNDLATTNKMVRNLILDSIEYWTAEYKVDGFRFDLMGLIDTETISESYARAVKFNPDILFTGEGWRMYNGPKGTSGADQGWMKETQIVSVFSDSFRDILKGGGLNEYMKGFLLDKKVSISKLFSNLTASPTNFTTCDPGNVLQYIESHDNLTFHDKTAFNLNLDPEKNKREIYDRLRIGSFAVLTSQGVPFIHAGMETGRTKEHKGITTGKDRQNMHGKFVSNSYDASDMINWINWNWHGKEEEELFRYTKGLIELRKSSAAFRMASISEIKNNITLINGENFLDLVIAYTIKAPDGLYIVCINADKVSRNIDTGHDLSKAIVLADKYTAGAVPIANPEGVEISATKLILGPLTGAVLKIP